jgi:Na+-driven multidrug efflux pump
LIDSADDHIKTDSTSAGDALLEDEDGGDVPYYDNYDWSELPRAAQTAAKTLGYNKNMWNKGTEPERLLALRWDGLTLTQKAAALELGWDKGRWNGISKDGSVDYLLSHVRSEVNRGWKMVYMVLAYDSRSKRILKLAAPATIANCLSPVLDGIMTAVFVTYMGSSKYLAWVMVDFFLGLCDSIVHGVAEAEGILTAQAIGMKKYFLAGQYVQLSVVLYAIVAIPTYGTWVFFMGDIMIGFGFGEEVTTYASILVPFSAGAKLIEGCFGSALEGLMWSEERGVAMTAIGLVSYVLYTIAFLVMIFGFGNTSLIALGAIDLAFALLYSIAVCDVCSCKGWLQKYKSDLFGSLAMSNRALTFGVLKMAAPLTLGHIMISFEWQVLTFFAAHMGAAEAAAWSIAAALWGVLEEFPSGVHHSAEILIGRYLGLGRPDLAKIVAYKSLLYSVLIAVVATGIFAYFREQIVYCFTEEEDLFHLVFDLVTLLCIGNAAMTIGNAAYSILETQGRTKVPVAIYGFSMTCITIPLSAWFVFEKNFGLESIMMSCVCGYSMSAFLMLVVVFTTNWPKMSRKALLKAAKYGKGEDAEKKRSWKEKAELVWV